MGLLFLIEGSLPGTPAERVKERLDAVSAAGIAAGAELIEAQVARDFSRLFLVIEAATKSQVEGVLRGTGIELLLVKQVRLIGQDLATVKARKGGSNYLVEWNFPAGLTMEAYLARKAQKSPLYAQVPEVRFERTYVCEDMTKCLCLYDSPDEATVKHARQVVGAPVDALTPIQSAL